MVESRAFRATITRVMPAGSWRWKLGSKTAVRTIATLQDSSMDLLSVQIRLSCLPNQSLLDVPTIMSCFPHLRPKAQTPLHLPVLIAWAMPRLSHPLALPRLVSTDDVLGLSMAPRTTNLSSLRMSQDLMFMFHLYITI